MSETIILMLCLNLQTSRDYSKYYTSCTYSLKAAAIQSDLKPKLDSLQQTIERGVEKRTNATFRAVVGILYGFVQNGQVLINSDIRPVADNLTIETSLANSSHSGLTFTWTF